MTVLLPLWAMEPEPPTTTPPVGPPASASPLNTIDPRARPTQRLMGQVRLKGSAAPEVRSAWTRAVVRIVRCFVLLLMVVIRQNVKLNRE